MKSKVGTEEKIGPLRDDKGNVLIDVESMGELLNRFFASVFSKEHGGGDGNVGESEDDQAVAVECIDYGRNGERAFSKFG